MRKASDVVGDMPTSATWRADLGRLAARRITEDRLAIVERLRALSHWKGTIDSATKAYIAWTNTLADQLESEIRAASEDDHD